MRHDINDSKQTHYIHDLLFKFGKLSLCSFHTTDGCLTVTSLSQWWNPHSSQVAPFCQNCSHYRRTTTDRTRFLTVNNSGMTVLQMLVTCITPKATKSLPYVHRGHSVAVVRNSYAHAQNRLHMLAVPKSEVETSYILKLRRDSQGNGRFYGCQTMIQGQVMFSQMRVTADDTACSVKGV